MRDRLRPWIIRLCRTLLAWAGEDVAIRLILVTEERDALRREVQELHRQASSRQARHAVLHDMINGLMTEAVRLDLAPQSVEWKRRQLYAQGKKRYGHLDDDVVALAAHYALFYVHEDRRKAKQTHGLTPVRGDV